MKRMPMTQKLIAVMCKHYCQNATPEEKDRFIDSCISLIQVGHHELHRISDIPFQEIKSEIIN
jgi:hypothetical protein